MGGMSPRSGAALLERFDGLAAARPLRERLGGLQGIYLVGGAVRDLLLDRRPVDLDLVVDGELAPVIARLGSPDRAHDRFGTCTVVLDGTRCDIARARFETYARPGALPTVSPAGIEVDLRRRDFTVNALALGLTGPRRGELVAAPGALGDLDRRRLRVLHHASFADDPTRLLRLARYAARLRFAIAPGTRELAGEAVQGDALATVSGPRIGAELRLLAAEPDPIKGLMECHDLGLDAAILPGFGLRDPDLAARALTLLPADGDPATVVLAAASAAVPTAELRAALDAFAFPAGERDRILAAAGGAALLAAALGAAGGPAEIALAAARAPVELVALAGAISPRAEAAARRWLTGMRDVALEIDGDDLLAAGVAPGPAIGAGLRGALAAKLDGRVHGAAQELAEALRCARDAGEASSPGRG